MSEVAQAQWQTLAAGLDALEAARKAFGERDVQAADSMRRIARTFKSATWLPANILELSKQLETGSDAELGDLADRLLALVRQVAAGVSKDKVRILIIDDDRIAARLLSAKLSAADREVVHVETAAAAEKVIDEKDINLIILDVILPDTDGRNLLMRLRERPRTAATTIIVVSGLRGAQPKSECFALGADDYFEKPFDPQVIATVVSTRLKRAVEFTRELRRDSVTGALNRAALHEAFQRACHLAGRTNGALSLGILDIDHFKQVNDTHGHLSGDEVLRRLAALFARHLRSTDIVARYGGDEFIVLLPGVHEGDAGRLLGRVLEGVREEAFRSPQGRTFTVSFSCGVVDVTPGETLEEVIAAADRYLYFAKAAGRGRVLTPQDTVTPTQTRILLADDGVTLASIVKHILSRERFQVIHCTDGEAALEMAPSAGVSLVLLDVSMPKMDGFEVLQHLRALPAFKKIPVLMITATGNKQDILRAMELGADDYLLKPFTPAELLSRIRRLLVAQATA